MQVDSSDSKQALADLKPEKPPMEPIFPAELRKRQPSELHLPGPLADWYRYAAAAAVHQTVAQRYVHHTSQDMQCARVLSHAGDIGAVCVESGHVLDSMVTMLHLQLANPHTCCDAAAAAAVLLCRYQACCSVLLLILGLSVKGARLVCEKRCNLRVMGLIQSPNALSQSDQTRPLCITLWLLCHSWRPCLLAMAGAGL